MADDWGLMENYDEWGDQPMPTDAEIEAHIAACQHEYYDGYYGVYCRKCTLFYPYGSEPWLPLDQDEDDGLNWDGPEWDVDLGRH